MADLYTLSLTVDPSGMVTGSAKATSALGGIGDAADKAEKKVKASSEGMRGSVDKITEGLIRMAEVVGLAIGAMEFAEKVNEARELAEEFERTGAIVQQMGVTFGVSSEQIEGTEKALRDSGATMRDARDATVELMNAHLGLGKATQLYTIAQNLAAKENIGAGQAMESLILAVQTGMARQLRHAGVVADFTKATRDMANQLGVSTDQLSEQQIEQARLNEVVRAAAGLQGAYQASLQTTAGQVKEGKKALDDLMVTFGLLFAEISKPALEAVARDLQDINKWAQANPAKLNDIKDAIVSIGEAAAVVAGLWLLWEANAARAAAKTAILAAADTIMSLIELAKAVETAADAFALLELTAEAINPAAVVASIAAIAGGLYAYKKMTEDSKKATDELKDSIHGLGPAIKTTGGVTNTQTTGVSSSQQAMDRLIQLRKEVPVLEAGLRGVGDAYANDGAAAGQLAEQQARLNDEIAKATVGLVGQDAAEAKALVTRREAATQYADMGKKVAAVRAQGEDALHTATESALAYHLVGDAVERAAIMFEYNTAVLKANRDMYGAAKTEALDYALKLRDAQLNALNQKTATEPLKNFVNNAETEWTQMWSGFVTDGVSQFSNMANQLRNIFASLVADLAKMAFEKKILPKLADLVGLSTDGAGAAAVAVTVGSVAHTDAATVPNISIGGVSMPGPQTASLPGMKTTASPGMLGSLAKDAGAGFVGAGLGYSIGSMTGNAVTGGIGGAGAGALAGFAMGGPVGAAIGGITGLVGGIMGAGKAAKEAAEAFKLAKAGIDSMLASMAALTHQGSALDAQLAAQNATFVQDKDQIEKGLAGKKHEDERNIDLAKLNQLEAIRIQQIKDEYAATQRETTESLQARLLRAQGNGYEADALDLLVKQQQEMDQAIAAGWSDDQIALLKTTQAAEKLRQSLDSVTNSTYNAVEGYKLLLDLFEYQPGTQPTAPTSPSTPTQPPSGTAPAPGSSTAPPTSGGNGGSDGGDSRITPNANMVINVQVDSQTIARANVKGMKQISQKQYGTQARWKDVVL